MTNRAKQLTWSITAALTLAVLALAVTRLFGLWPDEWILWELMLKAVLR